jgi:hypothetical protein
MKFEGMLTPEEAEREWGIPRSGELVITPQLSSKSKASQQSKNQPSGNGQKMQENSPQSEESNSAINKEQTQDEQRLANQEEEESELLDTIHVMKRRLLMLRRQKARPDLIKELSKRLKDMQDQLEST